MSTALPLRLWRSLHIAPFIPLLSRLITLACVVVLVGLLPWLSGRDPALSILRARSAEQEATPEALAAIRTQLGLDLGPLDTLQSWLMGWLHGDAGNSWISGAPVLPGMLDSARVSLMLMGFAMGVAIVTAALICLPVARCGLRGHPRRSSGAVGAALTAMPEFLLASI